MINQLLRFRESVEAWGVKMPQQWHHMLKDVPKGVKKSLKVLATISKEEFRFEVFDAAALRYYRASNHVGYLTFKYRHGEQGQSQVVKHLQDQADFVKLLTAEEHPGLSPLIELVATIASIDHARFYRELVEFLNTQGHVGDTYISLENDSLGNEVQCQSFLLAVSQRLRDMDRVVTTDRLDIYGNPADGYEEVFGDVNNIKLYSKNAQTKCYRRYGMNSMEACPIGLISRAMLAETLQAIMSKDNEAKRNKPGLWYRFTVAKDQQGRKKDEFVVFTSIFPKEDLIQIGTAGSLSQAEWEAKMTAVIECFRTQSVMKPDFVGEVFVIQKTKGATILRYAKSVSCEELSQRTLDWQQGMLNSAPHLATIDPPTLSTIVYYMNSSWRKTKEGYGRVNAPFFKINDAYDFFMGNPMTVDMFCRRFAYHSVPLLMKDFFHAPALIHIRNLIVHKLGILKGDFMNHWAFCLGRLFSQANYMYENFFKERGMDVPRARIGQRYYEVAYLNPERAYAEFGQAFAPCLGYHVSQNRGTYQYEVLTTRLYELVGDSGLPTKPTSRDQMLLQMGYSHFEKRTNKDNSSTNLQIEKEETNDAQQSQE